MLASGTTDSSWGDADDEPAGDIDPAAGNALDLTCKVLQDYVKMEPHELIASSLWVAHTYVYQKFMHTPRWWLSSPVRGRQDHGPQHRRTPGGARPQRGLDHAGLDLPAD